MQPMHPAMVEAHARARVEQLRREAGGRRPGATPRRPRVHRLRRSAGWLLINIGWRLVLPAEPVARAAA
jgi:hypothetical protein